MIIGVIPIKKSNYRFQGKNFLSIGGKPLIRLALDRIVPYVDKILISTDATPEVCAALGVPSSHTFVFKNTSVELYERDPADSEVNVEADTPIRHMLQAKSVDPDNVVMMVQVTNPLATVKTTGFCNDIFMTEKPDLLVTVNPNLVANGIIYICRAKQFINHTRFYAGNVHVVVTSYREGLDIDYPHQMKIAEALWHKRISYAAAT